MNSKALNDLLISFEKANLDSDVLYNFNSEIFMLFYNAYHNKRWSDIPNCVFMFLEIDNWEGMSLRCGVWQYYESASFESGKAEHLVALLKHQNENEIAEIYAYGIHDYSVYGDSEDYPQEWIDETDKIDNWISANQDYLYEWKKRLIAEHHDEILKLSDTNQI